MPSCKVFKTYISLPTAKCRTTTSDEVQHNISIRKQVTSLQQLDKKISKLQCRVRNHIPGKQAMTKNVTTWHWAKSFFNTNFHVDFVKPFIFTLDIASFGLFYKGNFKTL